MKKFTAWTLAFALVLSFLLPSGIVQANANSVKVLVDGVEVAGQEQAFESNGKVLIPIESLFTEAGFYVSEDEDGVVTVTNNYVTVEFDAANYQIIVDDEKANTIFPLTLRNGGNFIADDFLAKLEGFEVEVSEDGKTVEVTTNRVDVDDELLEKLFNVNLDSYSADMSIVQTMNIPDEDIGSLAMLMNLKLDFIQDPLSMYMESKVNAQFDLEDEEDAVEATEKDADGLVEEEEFEFVSTTYITPDGYYTNDGLNDVWVKIDNEFSDELFDSSLLQLDPATQFEITKKFLKNVNVFEYEDVYVVTQSLTTEDFRELIGDFFDIFSELLGGFAVVDEVEAQATVTTENVEVTEETEEEFEFAEEFSKEELEALFEQLNIEISELYFASTFDKATLYPIDFSGALGLTMAFEDEEVSISQLYYGVFSNINELKEIVVPEEVVKNAITMEEYLEYLEAQYSDEIEAEEE